MLDLNLKIELKIPLNFAFMPITIALFRWFVDN